MKIRYIALLLGVITLSWLMPSQAQEDDALDQTGDGYEQEQSAQTQENNAFDQARGEYEQGHYAQALAGFQALYAQGHPSREHELLVYYVASSYYHLERYKQALTLAQNALPWVRDKVRFLDLLGHIYWDNDNFDAAAAAFREATQQQSAWSLFDSERETRLDWLARSLEESAYDALQKGDETTARKRLQQALATLQSSVTEEAATERSHFDPVRHRIRDLEYKIQRLPQWGRETKFKPEPFTQEQLFAQINPFLNEKDKAKLKYPFRIDDEMRAYAKRHLDNFPNDLAKIRKLFRLFIAPSGLDVKSAYDFALHDKHDQEFYLGRDAWDVFHEQQHGLAQYGLDPEHRYRMGDCESQNNLFIALARAAGLNAFMVRTFIDVDKGYIGEHKAIGIITHEGKLVLVDLTWYLNYDVPYEIFRPLNDKEDFAYFITGYNAADATANHFYDASLFLDPQNEIALWRQAIIAMAAGKLDEMQRLVDKMPAIAQNWARYWVLRAKLLVKQDKPSIALNELQQAAKRIQHSQYIYGEIGDIARKLKQWDLAIDAYTTASQGQGIEVEKYQTAIGDTEYARAIDQGDTAMQRGQWQEAEEYFATALDKAQDGLDKLFAVGYIANAALQGGYLHKAFLIAVSAIDESHTLLAQDQSKQDETDGLAATILWALRRIIALGNLDRIIAQTWQLSCEQQREEQQLMLQILLGDSSPKLFTRLAKLFEDNSFEVVDPSPAAALLWFNLAATQGDTEAQYLLGKKYAQGQEGVNQDFIEAAKWYRKAAEQDNADAQYRLGVMLEQGQGVAKNEEEAATWYRKAAEHGHTEATTWTAEHGDAKAQYTVAKRYYRAKDYVAAVKWYRKAAEQDNADAQYRLGVMLEQGQGVAKNEEESATWYRKAADQGNTQAQNHMFLMYAAGRGVKQDYDQAFEWYRKANGKDKKLAEQGFAQAQFSLGVMYENGQGVKQDYVEAVKWYRKAAEQGYAYAQLALGVIYANGQGVPQDYTEAVKWFRKAAEQGYAYAQFALGVIYANGQVVKQDYIEAVQWYRKAADQGYADAQFALGVMYANGQGVPQDYTEAVKWFRKAEAQGGDTNTQGVIQNNIGWCQLLMGNFAAAGVSLTKAQALLRLLPAEYAVTTNLGHFYLLQGDRKTAHAWYEKTIPLIPDEATLKSGPLANFDLFINQGWQVEASKEERLWLETAVRLHWKTGKSDKK